MAEYIEREAAFNAILKLVPKVDGNGSCWVIRGVAAAAIDNIPTADVRTVVRAAWQSWEQDKPPCKWYSCDYCGFHALSKSNYCPNCGADMREES